MIPSLGEQDKRLLGATLGITGKMEAWPQTPLILQARCRDEAVRLCNSDLSFLLLG